MGDYLYPQYSDVPPADQDSAITHMEFHKVKKRTAEPKNIESSSGGQVSNVEGWNRFAHSFF